MSSRNGSYSFSVLMYSNHFLINIATFDWNTPRCFRLMPSVRHAWCSLTLSWRYEGWSIPTGPCQVKCCYCTQQICVKCIYIIEGHTSLALVITRHHCSETHTQRLYCMVVATCTIAFHTNSKDPCWCVWRFTAAIIACTIDVYSWWLYVAVKLATW